MSDLILTAQKAPKKLTPWEVLRFKFPAEEYVLLEEVSDASGFQRSRSLDFMLVNLWNSRGLAVTGIEMKSFRGDWLKEIKNPAKQENHFKYCDYFYLLTTKEKVASLDEIPPTWGWYHINERGILKTMKPAPKLESIPITRTFLCAMLRRAASKDGYTHNSLMEQRINDEAEKRSAKHKFDVERKAKEFDVLKSQLDEFEKISGIQISSSWGGGLKDDPKKLGAAFNLLMHNGTDEYVSRLERLVKDLNHSIEILKK